MAKRENFRFLSSDGRTMIHGVRWIPDSGKYEAVFQIVHGMVEYIERYEAFAEYLTEQGFLVVTGDIWQGTMAAGVWFGIYTGFGR